MEHNELTFTASLRDLLTKQKSRLNGLEEPFSSTYEKPDVSGMEQADAINVLKNYFINHYTEAVNIASIIKAQKSTAPLDRKSQKRAYLCMAYLMNGLAERAISEKLTVEERSYLESAIACYGCAERFAGMAEQIDEQATYSARLNAYKSNADTRMLQVEVTSYWEANIDPNLSADKAATLLLKQFPLSHRKLSQYVSAAKELRRASDV
jgi:hypothetical protein